MISAARAFLQPIGWRGKTPPAAGLEGALIFPRDRRATSEDGTEIAYTVMGATGPWVVLVPGYCCPDNFWRYLAPALAERYRVVVWDLRGLGLSGMPKAPGYRALNLTPDDFSIPKQAGDLRAVLEAEGIRRAALVGHSMGGQIVLEAYRAMARRISSIVMLTAPFESPLRTFYGRDFSNVFRGVRLSMMALPRASVLAWRALFLANPGLTHQLAQITRALGPGADLADMASYYRHMAYLDPLVMLMMAEGMRRHSAADVLSTVDVPALVIAGTLDTFTPPALAEAMCDALPDAELVVIENASHGAVIEHPDEVNDAILDFLDRRLQDVPIDDE